VFDRRAFLKAFSSAAALTGAPGLAMAHARASHTADGITLSTLHHLTSIHPGFAYVAGLPGYLGLPHRDLMRWIATADAQRHWFELQRLANVRCLIAGCDYGNAATPLAGLNLAVGESFRSATSPANRDDCTAVTICPHGSTLAVIADGTPWQQTTIDTRAPVAAARFHRLSDLPTGNPPQPSLATKDTINRIAEAVVAGIATHDALTRQIDTSYFAFYRQAKATSQANAV